LFYFYYLNDGFLEIPLEGYDKHHQHKVKQIDGEEILPFKGKQLVDSQTGEGPLEPDDDK
jgi:hypothetical protein